MLSAQLADQCWEAGAQFRIPHAHASTLMCHAYLNAKAASLTSSNNLEFLFRRPRLVVFIRVNIEVGVILLPDIFKLVARISLFHNTTVIQADQ
jgi:hypothetical protein